MAGIRKLAVMDVQKAGGNMASLEKAIKEKQPSKKAKK